MGIHPFICELFVDEIELLVGVGSIPMTDFKPISMFVVENGLSYETLEAYYHHWHLFICLITDDYYIIHQI